MARSKCFQIACVSSMWTHAYVCVLERVGIWGFGGALGPTEGGQRRVLDVFLYCFLPYS